MRADKATVTDEERETFAGIAGLMVSAYRGKPLAYQIACGLEETLAAERERVEGLVRRFLLFDSQRAVSWHEVQDCIAAIREGTA